MSAYIAFAFALIASFTSATMSQVRAFAIVEDTTFITFPVEDPTDVTNVNQSIGLSDDALDLDFDLEGKIAHVAVLTYHNYSDQICTIDAALGVAIACDSVQTDEIGALAVDPTTGDVYSVDDRFNRLFMWDPVTGDLEWLSELNPSPGTFIHSITIDQTGQMYMSSSKGLWKVDKNSGFMNFISFADALSMDFHPETNELFAFSHRSGNVSFVRVDPATGELTELASSDDMGLPEGAWPKMAIQPPQSCLADCNDDGITNVLDFICFQLLFQAGDMAADCDGNGFLNIADFVCFQNEYLLNCS